MGEYADLILEGYMCQECTNLLPGLSPGYPRTCDSCQKKLEVPVKVKCPTCGKKVKQVGLEDHVRAVHSPQKE